MFIDSICCIPRSYTCRSIDEYSPDEGGGSFEAVALLKSIGNFIGIFIGSFILGTLMGLLTALVYMALLVTYNSFKYTNDMRFRKIFKNPLIYVTVTSLHCDHREYRLSATCVHSPEMGSIHFSDLRY